MVGGNLVGQHDSITNGLVLTLIILLASEFSIEPHLPAKTLQVAKLDITLYRNIPTVCKLMLEAAIQNELDFDFFTYNGKS